MDCGRCPIGLLCWSGCVLTADTAMRYRAEGSGLENIRLCKKCGGVMLRNESSPRKWQSWRCPAEAQPEWINQVRNGWHLAFAQMHCVECDPLAWDDNVGIRNIYPHDVCGPETPPPKRRRFVGAWRKRMFQRVQVMRRDRQAAERAYQRKVELAKEQEARAKELKQQAILQPGLRLRIGAKFGGQ